MQSITVEELINYKILPFNIYTKGDKLLFPEGEVLTPGKFLQLRHIDVIYRKLNEQPQKKEQSIENKAISIPVVEEPKEELFISNGNKVSVEDDVQINKQAIIPMQDQIQLQNFYEKTVGDVTKTSPSVIITNMKDIRNKIMQDYDSMFDKVTHASQLRLLGGYDKCHAINVAMLTAALSRKLGYNDDFVSDITLAALLHDIGKICLPKSLLNRQNMTSQEQKLYQAHTTIGYNLIKTKMNVKEKIAKVALEHHERNDGTGFPYGKSGDFISKESQIISVCNYFDNLTYNKTQYKVYNAKEALRIMLEMGSKNFAIDVLYSFIYMYNYDDTENFNEMTFGT